MAELESDGGERAMTGVDEARDRRSWLERLGAHIPGFGGYRDRELRRDVDRMQREHLAAGLAGIKRALRGKARAWTDAGEIGDLDLFERLDQRLDGLSQAIRFAEYGQSGFFDVVKFGEAELERLYRFDLSLLEDLERLQGALATLPSPGESTPTDGLERLLDQVRLVDEKWSRRDTVVADVVATAGAASPGSDAAESEEE